MEQDLKSISNVALGLQKALLSQQNSENSEKIDEIGEDIEKNEKNTAIANVWNKFSSNTLYSEQKRCSDFQKLNDFFRSLLSDESKSEPDFSSTLIRQNTLTPETTNQNQTIKKLAEETTEFYTANESNLLPNSRTLSAFEACASPTSPTSPTYRSSSNVLGDTLMPVYKKTTTNIPEISKNSNHQNSVVKQINQILERTDSITSSITSQDLASSATSIASTNSTKESSMNSSSRPKLSPSLTSSRIYDNLYVSRRQRRKSYDVRTKVIYTIQKRGNSGISMGNSKTYNNNNEVSTCIFKPADRIILSDFKKVFKPGGYFRFFFEKQDGNKILIENDGYKLPFVERRKSKSHADMGIHKVIVCNAVEI